MWRLWCWKVLISMDSENLIFDKVVATRNLRIVDQTRLYKLAWLVNGKTVKVTKQCIVPSILGNIKVSVLCDVVIDVCPWQLHGCPWQFDSKVVWDGHTNFHTMLYNKKRVHFITQCLVNPKILPLFTFMCPPAMSRCPRNLLLCRLMLYSS